MSKFKIGDRVVVVSKSDKYMHDEFLNKAGTIVGGGGGYYDWSILIDEIGQDSFYEGELELELIYNSPLSKALR